MSWSSSRLDSVATPQAALSLIVGRIMELREAISDRIPWERQLYSTLLVSTPREVPLAIAWYEELVASSQDTIPNVELAILEAEAGLARKVADRLSEWKQSPGDLPAFADLLELAYFKFQDSRRPTQNIDFSIFDRLEAGWFRDRLAARLGAVAPNDVSLDEGRNSSNLLALVRLYTGLISLVVVAGLISIPWVIARLKSDDTNVAIGKMTIPPAWNGSTASAIVLRCAALFLMLGAGVGIFTPILNVSEAAVLVIAYSIGIIFLLVLSRRFLLDGTNENIGEALGISAIPGRGVGVASWVALLAGAGFLGDLGIIWLADTLEISVHWTEWFDEHLVWGDSLNLNLMLIAVIAVGPIFEELLFRGLIFGTVRQYFSFPAAAALSAGAFSIVHGYSMVGFVALLWTGFLWAWSVEKTRSLLPAMIAHGVNNLLMSFMLIIFLRE